MVKSLCSTSGLDLTPRGLRVNFVEFNDVMILVVDDVPVARYL